MFKSLAPNIGHAEAGHLPDIINERWTDHRLEGEGKNVDNRQRALEAIKAVYETLRKETGQGPSWGEVKSDFRTIIEIDFYDDRIKETSNLVGGTPLYSKSDWMEKALIQQGAEMALKPGFETTDWYRFHQAAKVHLARVADLIKEL